MTDKPTPILELLNIGKRFPGVVALDNVSLSVDTGEIVALIGENGAGKSTLMKILGGAINRDSGTVKIEGKEVEIKSPREASALGSSLFTRNSAFSTISTSQPTSSCDASQP
jgi:ABC-type sugar transport system ATPase subunit